MNTETTDQRLDTLEREMGQIREELSHLRQTSISTLIEHQKLYLQFLESIQQNTAHLAEEASSGAIAASAPAMGSSRAQAIFAFFREAQPHLAAGVSLSGFGNRGTNSLHAYKESDKEARYIYFAYSRNHYIDKANGGNDGPTKDSAKGWFTVPENTMDADHPRNNDYALFVFAIKTDQGIRFLTFTRQQFQEVLEGRTADGAGYYHIIFASPDGFTEEAYEGELHDEQPSDYSSHLGVKAIADIFKN